MKTPRTVGRSSGGIDGIIARYPVQLECNNSSFNAFVQSLDANSLTGTSHHGTRLLLLRTFSLSDFVLQRLSTSNTFSKKATPSATVKLSPKRSLRPSHQSAGSAAAMWATARLYLQPHACFRPYLQHPKLYKRASPLPPWRSPQTAICTVLQALRLDFPLRGSVVSQAGKGLAGRAGWAG